MGAQPNVLFLLPVGWDKLDRATFTCPGFTTVMQGQDDYAPEAIDYFVGFRPEPGFLKTLSSLKAVFSLGAGVDGFLRDPDYPRHVPLVRSVDPNLAAQMAEYVAMQALMIHRGARFFAEAQNKGQWRRRMLGRMASDIRVGILGLGVIGEKIAAGLLAFDFQVLGWSRSGHTLPGVTSFGGAAALDDFLSQSDILVCVLPLTEETRGILNAALFAQLPKGAHVINVARGPHLVEADLIAALDSGHLAGAVLDVFAVEPLPPDSPLWHHPKITVTPHVAGITEPHAALAYVADGVRRAEAGEPLDHVIDFGRGY